MLLKFNHFSLIQRTSKSLTKRGLFTASAEQCSDNNDFNEKRSWFRKLAKGSDSPIETVDRPHSTLLASHDFVYEMSVHAVKPDCMQDYLCKTAWFVEVTQEKKTGAELIGAWTVEVGNQDECILLYGYRGGYPTLGRAKDIYRSDPAFVDYRQQRNAMLRYRKNQILLSFSFWPEPKPLDGKHVYELRSYTIRPGSMMEWGNHWARGIKYRQESNPVCGLFSHIGKQFQVHHLWAYKSLEERQKVRNSQWHRPGWDDCVANTVPLIRELESNILIPVPFSPLQ